MYEPFFRQHLRDLRGSGANRTAKCPAHDDATASLSVNVETGLWKCHGGTCGKEGNVRQFAELIRVDPPQNGQSKSGLTYRNSPVIATYEYRNEQGTLLYMIHRTASKQFPAQAANGAWKLDGVRRVLYRLPELIAGKDPVLVVEGEKDVETARKLGFTATCNPGGAGKWKPEYSTVLAGRQVFVIPDNDQPGMDHANFVVRDIERAGGKAKILRIEVGKDLTEWIERGGTKEQLTQLTQPIVAATPTEPEDDFRPMSMAEIRQEIEEIKRAPRIPTGIRELDEAIGGGYMGRKIVIVGAFVGNGKTTFLVHQSVRHAMAGHPVLFISAELSKPEIGLMVEAALAPGDDPEIPNLSLIYADRPLEQVLAMADKWIKQHDGNEKDPVILVDFAQKINNSKTQSRELQVSEIVWGFQRISKQSGALMILAAQLNRQSQGGTGDGEEAPKPQLHHLRESGNIEQVGDLVLLLQKTGDDSLKFWIAKHRSGKTSDVEVSADYPKCAFGTMSDSQKWGPLADKVVEYLDAGGQGAPLRDVYRDVRFRGKRTTHDDIVRAATSTLRFRIDENNKVWKC